MDRIRNTPTYRPNNRALLALLAAVVIMLALVPQPTQATPEEEVRREVAQRSQIARMANQGNYAGALDALLPQTKGDPQANYLDAAYALARGSELLIYLNNKAQFDARMPALQTLRTHVERARPTDPRAVAICTLAIALHNDARNAQANVLAPPASVEAIQRQLVALPKMTSRDADDLLDQVVAIRDDVAATKLAIVIIERMEKYATMPAKYHRITAVARLISRLADRNPLRARDLARGVMAYASENQFTPDTELEPLQRSSFESDFALAQKTLTDSPWQVESGPQIVEPAVRQQLMALLTQFAGLVKSGQNDQAGKLIHPDSKFRTRILDALASTSLAEMAYSGFGEFVLDPTGTMISVACSVTTATKVDPTKPKTGPKTIIFRKSQDSWLIDRL